MDLEPLGENGLKESAEQTQDANGDAQNDIRVEDPPPDINGSKVDKPLSDRIGSKVDEPPLDRTGSKVDKPPSDKIGSKVDEPPLDRHDVEAVLRHLIRSSAAQATRAGERLDRVYKRYNASKMLPTFQQSASRMIGSVYETVESVDLIIDELLEAIYRQEEQMSLFCQLNMENLQAMLDEEKCHIHRSRTACLQAFQKSYDKALATLTQSNEARQDINDYIKSAEWSSVDRLVSQYHAMIAWSDRSYGALREKYARHNMSIDTEVTRKILAAEPDLEDILTSIVRLNSYTHQLKDLIEAEHDNRTTVQSITLHRDAIQREVIALRRRAARDNEKVELYARRKREMLAKEHEMRKVRAAHARENTLEADIREMVRVKRLIWNRMRDVVQLCNEINEAFAESK